MYVVTIYWVGGVKETFEVEADRLNDTLEAYDIDEVERVDYQEV